MLNFSKSVLTAVATAMLCLSATSVHADVMLTFDGSNVTQNDCTGAMQPTCVTTAATSFQESMVIASMPLSTTDTSFGAVMQSNAFYNFAYMRSGTPYTPTMSSRVNNAITGGQSFTQLDNTFDNSSTSGNSSALIYSDVISDTTDNTGNRTQQEYKISYNLLGGFISSQFYTSLTSDTLFSFFTNNLGNIGGSFDELGTTSTLDPVGLGLSLYAFTEFTGDVKLIDVQSVPEPGMLALWLAGLASIAGVRRVRQSAEKQT
ncbi:hypothetical protein AAKU64_004488 [Undibacterium sp. GrIS 1.8]|uniref:PEP-CTERM sorting domain-containing protein n=2 Tax=unclassified Undibacterium TaxID=2630295 RepID=UPI00339572DD